MKSYLYLSLLFLSIATCLAQTRDVRQLDYFNQIESGGSWDVYIKRGSSEKVIIEAEEGPIDKIMTEIENNTLKIKSRDNNSWWGSNPGFKNVRIYVTFTDLEQVVGSGSGNIKIESSLAADNISIISSGSGGLYCEEDIESSGDLKIINSGSGSIKIMALVSSADDVRITNSGSGSVSMGALTADELSINNSGSGGLKIESGKTRSQSITLSGSGGIKLEDVATRSCAIKKSGSGSIYVNVEYELTGISSGSGDIYVKGGKPQLDFQTSGSGKIKYVN